MIMSKRQIISVSNCPIKLKVCSGCYWRRNSKCVFPQEGYDLRSRLETERKRLVEELEQLKTGIRQAHETREGSPFGKREEAAAEGFESAQQVLLRESTKERLSKVEHALGKFDNGTYGLCDNCGQTIDLARLEALPQASLCLVCMGRRRHSGK